jgi:hypothetical protein
MNICCTQAVFCDPVGWWCPQHGDLDEQYADLQAENLAAADIDPDWPATYE